MKILKKSKRREMCRTHFGDGDILIDDFILNPIHIMDERFDANSEFDFYMDSGKDCYLLRLRNNSRNIITLCKHYVSNNDFICIVVEKPLQFNILEELKLIVRKLKAIEVPQKIYEEISLSVFE